MATAHDWTRFHLEADRCFTWELAAADRRDADGSRLTAHDWTGLTWQQLVATSVGSIKSWFQQSAATNRGLMCVSLVVAGCGLAAALFVFELDIELVICEVVNL